MEESIDFKIKTIRDWLGTGSINIFGIQFSGKDTVGKQLTDLFEAQFVSSGDVMRSTFLSEPTDQDDKIWHAAKVGSLSGSLMPTNEFREMMAVYLSQPAIEGKPLILSTVGRWIGEEGPIMKVLEDTGHPTKAVVLLNITEEEAWGRWRVADKKRNGGRHDDAEEAVVARRFNEYKEKTLPVIEVYRSLGILLEVNGSQSREAVMKDTIEVLYNFSRASTSR